MAWIHDWTWREYVPGVVARGISRLALPWEPEWDAWPVPVETARDAERAQMSQPGRRTGRTLAVQYDLGQVMIDRLAALRHEVIAHTNDTVIPNDGHPERHYIVLMALAQYAAVLAWFWEHEPDSYPPEQRQRPDQMRVMGWHVFPSEAVQTWCGFELVPMAPEDYVQQQGQCDRLGAPLLSNPSFGMGAAAWQTEGGVEMHHYGCGFRVFDPDAVTDHGEPSYDALDAAGELGGMTLDEWSAWLDREERETR